MRRIDGRRCWRWGRFPWWARTSGFPGGFTILAEKCPNRRGVEAIIAHFAGRVATSRTNWTELDRGEFAACGWPADTRAIPDR